jgi:hypothetical protein
MRKTWLYSAWNGLAALVFLFAIVVSLTLAAGGLDPVGFAYYGVGFSSRMPVLFALLASLQEVAIVEAILLARRLRGFRWWASLALAALTLPFLLVLAIARLDLWRFAQRARAADIVAGILMMMLLAGAFRLHRWAWRREPFLPSS